MIYIIIVAAIMCGDLLIKRHIEKRYSDAAEKKILGGFITIHKHHNEGIAGGYFKKYSRLLKYVIAVFVGIAIFLFVQALRKGNNESAGVKTGYALIVGGAASNILDRFAKGYVTDYISFKVPVKRIRNLVFNISDFCIVGGAILSFQKKNR